MTSDVDVIIEPPLPDVNVNVEPPLPDINVIVSSVGLPGRNGKDGVDGQDSSADLAIAEHVADETPHPVYDDGPSLFLLYQNAKV